MLHHLLHLLPAEAAHRMAIRGAALLPAGRPVPEPLLRTRLAGLDLPVPVGLAAGFDKNARGVPGLLALGFGHVEIGTVTARPQPGNEKPRLFRLVDDSETPVHIFADFHCDQYGEITNDHHLSLSVMVGDAPLIMDPGIKDVLELPILENDEDDEELCAVSVLAAVVDYANNLIQRAAKTFAPLPAAVPVQSPPPLELRIVPADGVRDQADPDYNPELSAAEREQLRAASDTDISVAIAASWSLVADRFYEIHDELQAAAVTRLLK